MLCNQKGATPFTTRTKHKKKPLDLSVSAYENTGTGVHCFEHSDRFAVSKNKYYIKSNQE